MRNRDRTGQAETRRRPVDDVRCCTSSCRVRREVKCLPKTESLLSGTNQLLQTALDSGKLFTRAEAAAPLRRFLETLLVIARTDLFLARAGFVLMVESPFLQNRPLA